MPSPGVTGILYPLDVLYARCGVAPPVARPMRPSALPPVAFRLLVHEAEMTRTLERHIRDRLIIRALVTLQRGRGYFRRALLAERRSGRPVAMGAVRLRLDLLGQRTRARILRAREPLGRVLREGHMNVTSLPTAFFRLRPNAELMAVFGMAKPAELYGRQTRLVTETMKLGDVVEILAPL